MLSPLSTDYLPVLSCQDNLRANPPQLRRNNLPHLRLTSGLDNWDAWNYNELAVLRDYLAPIRRTQAITHLPLSGSYTVELFPVTNLVTEHEIPTGARILVVTCPTNEQNVVCLDNRNMVPLRQTWCLSTSWAKWLFHTDIPGWFSNHPARRYVETY